VSGTAVRIEGVSRSFGPVAAVRDLSLHLEPGVTTALVGPSGCGKTTTLRMVAGFERPDAGTIMLGDEVVSGGGRWVEPEHRRVGMVFQQLALFPHLDVAGNIAYGLSGEKRSGRRSRVSELLELVGLSGYGARFPDELSGGQAQRVAVARALAPRPQVLLLDEPFSSLDVTLRSGLRAEIRAILRREGVTALLVTHDQDEALSMGDRVAVMLDGALAQVGAPDEVYGTPSSAGVADFLGDANLLPGSATGATVETELGRLATASATHGPVVVLVRPEDLDVSASEQGDGTVADAEYFGHDQLLTVVLASGRRLRVRLHARQRLQPGAPVAVRPVGTAFVTFPADG